MNYQRYNGGSARDFFDHAGITRRSRSHWSAGSSVIDEALKRGIKVRALTRIASSEAANALRAKGIEICEADMEDLGSLVIGFKGASAIFAVTNFWAPFIKYATAGDPDKWTLAKANEVRLGKNIVDAAAKTLDTLEHFVFSSLPSPDRLSNHEMPDLLHYEGKAEITRYISEHDRLAKLTTVLYCGYYMENFTRWNLNGYLRPRSDRTGALTISTRATPTASMPLLNGHKDIGPVVAAILSNQPQGVDGPPVLAVSEEMDFQQICITLQNITNQKIDYVQSPPGLMGKRDPIIGTEFEQMYEYYNKYGFDGGERWLRIGDLVSNYENLSTFEDFVKTHNWEGFAVDDAA